VVTVCGKVFTAELIEELRQQVVDHRDWSRRRLSHWLCERLEWKNAAGRYQTMAARVALIRLQARKEVRLPKVGKAVEQRGRREPFEAPRIRCLLKELGPVELVEVTGRERKLSRLWNTLVAEFHPQGYQPMAGAQMRYLVRTNQGWAGAVGWGAAAWRLKDRDRRIGWSERARRQHLRSVVCNWRFLILPTVRVPELASHVLGQCSRRLGKDWRRRYGYEPVLLETFVESDKYAGSCYRAANWQKVGQTRGRGRNDGNHQHGLPPKDIYLYPLRKNWRECLCQEPPQPVQLIQAGAEPASDWTQEEWAAAVMPDRRLEQRLRTLAADFYPRPQANIPQACGSRAKTKAAYRFVEHPDIQMEDILAPHREATLRRMAAEPVVLAVQDSTALTYGNRPGTEGLGPTNNDHQPAVGFWLHSTMAYSVSGLALGLIDVQVWTREAPEKRVRQRHLRGIQE